MAGTHDIVLTENSFLKRLLNPPLGGFFLFSLKFTILSPMQKKLITTAIPYMNGAPHIGHALEVILTDVIARGHRLIDGKDSVFFLTGADEHGSKIFKAAEAAGGDVMKMLDENVRHFQDMNTALSISNDGYIRTTDKKKHWPVVQALWMRLFDN